MPLNQDVYSPWYASLRSCINKLLERDQFKITRLRKFQRDDNQKPSDHAFLDRGQ